MGHYVNGRLTCGGKTGPKWNRLVWDGCCSCHSGIVYKEKQQTHILWTRLADFTWCLTKFAVFCGELCLFFFIHFPCVVDTLRWRDAQVDEKTGRMTGQNRTYAICGNIRRMVRDRLIVTNAVFISVCDIVATVQVTSPHCHIIYRLDLHFWRRLVLEKRPLNESVIDVLSWSIKSHEGQLRLLW